MIFTYRYFSRYAGYRYLVSAMGSFLTGTTIALKNPSIEQLDTVSPLSLCCLCKRNSKSWAWGQCARSVVRGLLLFIVQRQWTQDNLREHFWVVLLCLCAPWSGNAVGSLVEMQLTQQSLWTSPCMHFQKACIDDLFLSSPASLLFLGLTIYTIRLALHTSKAFKITYLFAFYLAWISCFLFILSGENEQCYGPFWRGWNLDRRQIIMSWWGGGLLSLTPGALAWSSVNGVGCYMLLGTQNHCREAIFNIKMLGRAENPDQIPSSSSPTCWIRR